MQEKIEFPFGRNLQDAHLAKVEQSAEIIQKMKSWIDGKKNIFYFCGNVGTGKTYFCAAFYNLLKEKNKHCWAFTEYKFFGKLRGAIQKNWDPLYEIEKICESPYVILDDFGSSSMTDWQKEMLFEFVNMRMDSGLPTLITSNLTKKDIRETFHERIESRLFASKNTVIELNGEDRRQRIENGQ